MHGLFRGGGGGQEDAFSPLRFGLPPPWDLEEYFASVVTVPPPPSSPGHAHLPLDKKTEINTGVGMN